MTIKTYYGAKTNYFDVVEFTEYPSMPPIELRLEKRPLDGWEVVVFDVCEDDEVDSFSFDSKAEAVAHLAILKSELRQTGYRKVTVVK